MPVMITEALVARAKPGVTLRDERVRGFVCVVGKNAKTFRYEAEFQSGGQRHGYNVNLGRWPDITVADARENAKTAAGKRPRRSKDIAFNPGVTLDGAMKVYLADRRAEGPKAQTWATESERIYNRYMKERWGARTLLSLSGAPTEVRAWFENITEVNGESAANHAGRVLRSCYNHARKGNRGLPIESPTSAIKWHPERRRNAAIKDLRAWKQKVDEYGAKTNPIYACWYRLNILTGARPSELARLRWEDVMPEKRIIVVDKSKDYADIEIPMSAAIARELKKARDAARTLFPDSKWVFPSGRGKKGHITRLRTDKIIGGN